MSKQCDDTLLVFDFLDGKSNTAYCVYYAFIIRCFRSFSDFAVKAESYKKVGRENYTHPYTCDIGSIAFINRLNIREFFKEEDPTMHWVYEALWEDDLMRHSYLPEIYDIMGYNILHDIYTEFLSFKEEHCSN